MPIETTISLKINQVQIISLLKQLETKDRISIFNEFKDDWANTIPNLHALAPLSINEYNSKLAAGLNDYTAGNVITHDDLVKETAAWKKQKR